MAAPTLPTLYQNPPPYVVYSPTNLNYLGTPVQGSGPYGVAPFNNPDWVWIPVGAYGAIDQTLQFWVNINTGDLVYGQTDLTANTNIHLYTWPGGTDTGYQLDQVTSQVSQNANILGLIVSVATRIGGLIIGGAGGAAVNLVGTTTTQLTPPTYQSPQVISPTGTTVVSPTGVTTAPTTAVPLPGAPVTPSTGLAPGQVAPAASSGLLSSPLLLALLAAAAVFLAEAG